MKPVSLFQLYLIFLKIGAILLGGGYVILPILTSELSEKRKLLSEDELVEFFALAQALPGIVAANISMFTGYRLRGKFGAVSAMLGVVTVPFISIILIAEFLNAVTENNLVQGALSGVEIAVIALILLTVKEMWQKTETDRFFYIIFFLSLIGLLFFKLSPITTIVCFTLFGIGYKAFFKRGEKQ